MERINTFKNIFEASVSLLAVATFCGCAGPTTPFGAIHSVGKPKTETFAESFVSPEPLYQKEKKDDGFYSPQPVQGPSLEFFPDAQVWHDKSRLKVTIHDPRGIPASARLHIYYNGSDVSRQLLSNSERYLNDDGTRLIYEFDHLRIPAYQKNKIHFAYSRDFRSQKVVERYPAPDCSVVERDAVKNTLPFAPDPLMLVTLERWASHHHINPALLTGLVAQESAFDPKAVSWAKAIGLTQVTPIGDKQIARVHKKWPRSQKISRYPAAVVKTMIESGSLSESEDWRLDPELSVRGGLTLLEYFRDYWTTENNYQHLTENFQDPEQVLTLVLLASYHSGGARVKRAIRDLGDDFLEHKSLKEAKKYVKRVSSYCYHFARERESFVDENEGGSDETTP